MTYLFLWCKKERRLGSEINDFELGMYYKKDLFIKDYINS